MYTLSTKYPFYVQSNISCGEVYEIAGKLISIRLPQNNNNTITRCGALSKKKWIFILFVNYFHLDLLNTRTQHGKTQLK